MGISWYRVIQYSSHCSWRSILFDGNNWNQVTIRRIKPTEWECHGGIIALLANVSPTESLFFIRTEIRYDWQFIGWKGGKKTRFHWWKGKFWTCPSCPWHFHDISMTFPWHFHDISMTFPCLAGKKIMVQSNARNIGGIPTLSCWRSSWFMVTSSMTKSCTSTSWYTYNYILC